MVAEGGLQPRLYLYKGKTLGFTSLDVSNNTKLERLYLACNRITNLDLSNNPNVTNLWAQYNPIQSLNLSNKSRLDVIVLKGCSVLNYLNIKGTARNGVPRTCITENTPNLFEIKVNNVAAINAWRAIYPGWYLKDPEEESEEDLLWKIEIKNDKEYTINNKPQS